MTAPSQGMSRGLTLLFAFAGGAAVGNLYWAQPLLADIAAAFNVPIGAAGWLITATQIGYALGVLFIVPLGDTRDRRRLIPLLMTVSAAALAVSALAPTFMLLLVGLAAVGLTTVAGQLLTPLAGDLARDDQRGRVVGTIISGLLTGILTSRTISGLMADAINWRAIYVAAAVMMLLMAVLMRRALPSLPPRASIPYGALLASVFAVVHKHRVVRITLLMNGAAFGAFTMFWTGLTFLLSAPPFSYSVTQIGLVGLVGLAGALAAQRSGRLHDKGWAVPAIGAALLLNLIALIMSDIGGSSIAMVLVAVLLVDVAFQGANVLNQTRVLSVEPAARSRLNTAYVTSNFVGGAAGSSLAGLLWQHGGWSSVMRGACGLIAFSLAIWLTQRRVLAGAGPRNA